MFIAIDPFEATAKRLKRSWDHRLCVVEEMRGHAPYARRGGFFNLAGVEQEDIHATAANVTQINPKLIAPPTGYASLLIGFVVLVACCWQLADGC